MFWQQLQITWQQCALIRHDSDLDKRNILMYWMTFKQLFTIITTREFTNSLCIYTTNALHFAAHWMISHLLCMHRNITRIVYDAQKKVSVTATLFLLVSNSKYVCITIFLPEICLSCWQHHALGLLPFVLWSSKGTVKCYKTTTHRTYSSG